MSPDLQLLAWSAVLALVQMLVAVIGARTQVEMAVLAGNRDDMPPLIGWPARAERAHRNMLESLVVFAIAVLVVQAAGRADATSALGAQLFFWGRVAYAIVYVAGVPWLRSAVWGVSIAGILLVLKALI